MNDGEWPSIPYYILDGAAYKAEVVANASAEVAVRVTSPEDPRTGVQFIRTFHVYAGHHADQGGSGHAQHQPPADSLGHLAPDSE
jgi:hypothetical protein